MSDLKDLIKRHSIKNFNKIRRICEPLLDLEIPVFDFYRIEENGRFGSLTNSPEFLDYYYTTKQYLKNPYLSHPSLFRSGYAIAPVVFQPEQADTMHKLFGISYLFIILQQKVDAVEAFIFGNRHSDPQSTLQLISQTDLLQKFASYFKREAGTLIRDMMEDHFDLEKAKGDAYYNPDLSLSLLNKNPKSKKFLKTIAPLSSQENRCLELLKQGCSSQECAAILKLQKRTVDFYFDNIRQKLSCSSKRDLLQW